MRGYKFKSFEGTLGLYWLKQTWLSTGNDYVGSGTLLKITNLVKTRVEKWKTLLGANESKI